MFPLKPSDLSHQFAFILGCLLVGLGLFCPVDGVLLVQLQHLHLLLDGLHGDSWVSVSRKLWRKKVCISLVEKLLQMIRGRHPHKVDGESNQQMQKGGETEGAQSE